MSETLIEWERIYCDHDIDESVIYTPYSALIQEDEQLSLAANLSDPVFKVPLCALILSVKSTAKKVTALAELMSNHTPVNLLM